MTATFENRLFKAFLIGSIGVHLCLFMWSQWRGSSIGLQEVSIQADLVLDSSSEVESIHAQKREEEVKVDRQLLPQLPKQYEVNEKPPVEEGKTEAVPLQPDPVQAEEKEKAKEPEPAKPKEDQEQWKQDRMFVLQKKQALERLIKEKARREEKFASENASPLNQTLLARKKQLEKGLQGEGLSDGSFDRYGKMLKDWMQKFYTLPEVYSLQAVGDQAVVELVLDSKGSIRSITLVTSSNNEAFDQLALSTVQKAAPFPAPPRELVGKKIHYRFDPNKVR